MKKNENYSECLKCGKLGIEKKTEVLPDKGNLYKVFHDEGETCEFVEYPSLSIFLKREEPRKNTNSITCPICGTIGIICSYRRDKIEKSHNYDYYIKHERLDGYWGKNGKTPKYRRCYIKTDEQKKLVLERLGNTI